jgi:hypothetical protein
MVGGFAKRVGTPVLRTAIAPARVAGDVLRLSGALDAWAMVGGLPLCCTRTPVK